MKISKVLAGMSAAAILAAMAIPAASAASTTIWQGPQQLTGWSDFITITTDTFESVNAGDKITFNFSQDAADAKLQAQNGAWTNIPGFGASWGGVDLEEGQTSYTFEVSEDAAANINGNVNEWNQIINVKGVNITLNSVVLETGEVDESSNTESETETSTPLKVFNIDTKGKPSDGVWEVDPLTVLSEEDLAKVDKVEATFKNEAFFNGTIGANTVAANGWDNSGQIDVSDPSSNSKFTWNDVGGLLVKDGTANLQVQVWWMNGIGDDDTGYSPATLELNDVTLYDNQGNVLYKFTGSETPSSSEPESSSNVSSSTPDSSSSTPAPSSSNVDNSSNSSNNGNSSNGSNQNNNGNTTTPNGTNSAASGTTSANPKTGATSALAAVGVVLAGAAVVAAKKKK